MINPFTAVFPPSGGVVHKMNAAIEKWLQADTDTDALKPGITSEESFTITGDARSGEFGFPTLIISGSTKKRFVPGAITVDGIELKPLRTTYEVIAKQGFKVSILYAGAV